MRQVEMLEALARLADALGKLFFGIFGKPGGTNQPVPPAPPPLPPVPTPTPTPNLTPTPQPLPTPTPTPTPQPKPAISMYDSVNPFDIPIGVPVVAGYVDGLYAWSAAGWARHSGSHKIRITVTGNTLDADAIDFETGNMDAAWAASWAKRMHDAGRYPVIYVQESRLSEAQRALAVYPPFPVGYWRANWNGSADLQPNDIAHQYGNPTITGGHYDISVVRGSWPGVY